MRRQREDGFTLVETLAALMIFSLVTLGTTPLLLSSMRGATLSGTFTVGKNLASEAMERVRGFPFFESVKNLTNPPRRDVLDLYFPDRVAGTGGTGFTSDNTYVTLCTSTSKLPSASAGQACPLRLPAGFTLRYDAQFVNPGPAPAPGAKQTFVVRPPGTNYDWSTTATESPPSRLLLISVTASWTAASKPRSYSLSSLVGVRHLTDEQFRAHGKVGSVILTRTSYVDGSGRLSTLTVNGGESESSLTSRAMAEADQEVRGGRATLVRQEYVDGGGNIVPAATLQDTAGAAAFLHAPPNPVISPVSGGNFTMSHPEIPSLPVAFVGNTTVMETGAATEVVNELPRAVGNLRYTSTGNHPTIWVNNQADLGSSSELMLAPLSNEGMVTFVRSGSNRMRADTSAQAYSLTTSGGGYVESKANAAFYEMRLFPTTFVTSTDRAVVKITNFTASFTCKAVASTGAQVATGTWSATLSYWEDPPLAPPGYTNVSISGTTAGTAQPLTFNGNPLVYDSPLGEAFDLYLFRDDSLGRKGYLLELSTTPTPAVTNTDGSTSVSMDHAIEIITAPTKPGVNETALNITIGNLSCGAVDNR
ncbi:MAG: type II secretion system GspH family protein [Actinomycetota bacterium]|nr:type II secretion system GspH family protein [Actinomycetota bacterium]